MPPAARLAVLPLAALALAGCGGGGERGGGPEPPAPPAPEAAVAIVEPQSGARVRGPRIRVAGTAEPDREVIVSAGCHATGCVARSRSDGRGRWRARVRVVAGRDGGALVHASYAGAAGVSYEGQVRVRVLRARQSRAGRRGRAKAEPPGTVPLPVPGEAETSAPAGDEPRRLVMVGDSLAEGTQGLLERFLPGWEVVTDARRGRPLGDGMRVLASIPASSRPTVYAFSLFTNDDPGNVGALEAAVRASAQRAGARGCAVWATIVRPPLGGRGYGPANARLAQLERELPNVLVVPWAETVRASPALLSADGVHATPAGYRVRAHLYAQAARACG